MAWTPLGTQFCLELAFGVLLGLVLLARAPLGLFFHRLMGLTAALPLVVVVTVPPTFGGREWSSPVGLAALAALLALPWLLSPVRTGTRRLATIWATLGAALGLVLAVQEAPGVQDTTSLVLGSLSAMATGGVAGSVGLAMVLGHWYLTIPQLPIAWLARINRFTVVWMLLSALLLGLTCALFGADLGTETRPLLGSWGLFFLGSRIAVGLALPLLFAWMTAGSLKYENTRSATGILYASTVLVLIGTAASISLQDSYGIPL